MAELSPSPQLFDRDIDIAQIETVRRRFFAINTERLQQTHSVLPSRQAIILDVLPLLFHFNHPSLPGYSGQQCPRGIDNFQASPTLIERLQRHIAGSFYCPENNTTTAAQIHSIFLMGSCGSIAQSSDSDLDIWLCHSANLEGQALKNLYDKAAAIAAWALGLGLEVHFFLMDSEQFRRGKTEKLSADAAGTSQHYLLLDEFYRSAILLAGRYPIWWLVPPEEETNYREFTAILRHQGIVSSGESIDFGGVANIPPGEFIGAGIWQLYKAISAPYKSLLKLLLAESYAQEHPAVQPICQQYKQLVYDDHCSAAETDTYVLIYQRLERYLVANNAPARLELARRAFYFKTDIALSQSTNGTANWRRKALKEIVANWGWQNEHILNLDTRQQWKIKRVREEHQNLVSELNGSYHFLQQFAHSTQQQALIKSVEMAILGRKLYAAFERKRNKIERLNPGIVGDISEHQLYFSAVGYGAKRYWQVSTQPGDNDGAVLHNASHLSGLLSWCYCNQLINARTQLRLQGENTGISEHALTKLARFLRRHLPAQLVAADPQQHEVFTRPKEVVSTLWHFNLGSDLISSLGQGQLSDEQQPYAVNRVEVVIVNSWGEVSSAVFNGENAPIHAIKAYHQILIASRRNRQRPTMRFFKDGKNSQQLLQAINHLGDNIAKHLFSADNNKRFVLKINNGFHILQVQGEKLETLHAENYAQLIECLGRKQRHYSEVVLDKHCASDSALACILRNVSPDCCAVFYYQGEQHSDVFTVDERGSMNYQHLPTANPKHFIPALLNFLARCQLAQNAKHPIKLYALKKTENQWYCDSKDGAFAASDAGQAVYLEAVAISSDSGRVVFDMLCNNTAFHYADKGAALFAGLATSLHSAHPGHAWFRLDHLNLSQLPPQQTSVYMRYKYHIEAMLNEDYDSLALVNE